ncbi:hypothetical protein IAD21_03743 [Abditibacteriota bacterium]|nr:hypothetical protein IAD21_03743 [Abditibacteriota bacterium]
MRPQEESLTPKQQRIFNAVLLLITLIFSSVFIYAYWKGTRVRVEMEMSAHPLKLARVSRFKNMRMRDIQEKVPQIARGASGQENPGRFAPLGNNSYNWTIHKLPALNGDGRLPVAPVIAYNSSPNGWHISPMGVVTVPSDAELGLHLAHYCVGRHGHDYFFEVVPVLAPRSSPSSFALTTSSVSSTPPGKN